MGHVPEYESNGAPIKVEGELSGVQDLLQYPVHANSKHMYVVSGDVVEFLSDNVKDLSNGKWMKSTETVDIEGPLLATWLVAIQVHAERGCSECVQMHWEIPLLSGTNDVSSHRSLVCNSHSLSQSQASVTKLLQWWRECGPQ